VENKSDPGPDSIPRRPLHARTRSFRDKVFIAVDNESAELSETAAVIWRSVDGSRTIHDIAIIIQADYEVAEDQALADVLEFMSEMASSGFIEY
jgi:Coenzyme PQQ synthesis protein D (PqqD)